MSRVIALLAAGFIGAATLVPGSASAQGPLSGNGLYCGGFPGIAGYGANLLPYSLGHVPVPPYFALHPPVYYSQPVARTYGYSPYAYPGSVRTPDVAPTPTAALIENPYVEPTQRVRQDTKGKTVSTSTPEVILNPYVTSRVADSR